MALRIEKSFGVSMDTLLRVQAWYDSHAMRQRAAEIDVKRYTVDVEDTASTIVELQSGATGTILSSWATRVRRDDLLTFQIDGVNGSAIAGLHRCWVQPKAQTP